MLSGVQGRHVRRGLLIFPLGALTVVAGALTLKEPVTALATVTLLLAAHFVVAGIVERLAAFSARPERGWGWLLASGILSVLLGMMLWRQFRSGLCVSVGALPLLGGGTHPPQSNSENLLLRNNFV